jgi:hypothetical protein
MKKEYTHNTNEEHEREHEHRKPERKLETTGKITLKAHKNTKKKRKGGA